MSHCVSTALMFVGLLAPSARAEVMPERAEVRTHQAPVWSGPGEKFYPTGRLASGQSVEVYRRRADGWCAIRPPEGSFSYVRADHVRPVDGSRLLEVIQEGAKTRVGSAIRPSYQVEYVALRRGERLARLDGPVGLGSSRYGWYRIAPPSGEFRWIRTRDVRFVDGELAGHSLTAKGGGTDSSKDPAAAEEAGRPGLGEPLAGPADAGSLGSGSPAERSPTSRSATADSPQPRSHAAVRRQLAESLRATTIDAAAENEGIALVKLAGERRQMTTEPISRSSSSTQGSAVRAALLEPAESGGGNSSSASPNAVVPSARSGELVSVSDAEVQLAELELALSRMVTQEVDRWELGALRRQVEQLHGHFPDESGERAAAQLLERIDEFATLQNRHRELGSASADDSNRTVSLAAALSPRPPAAALAPGLASAPPEPPNDFLARQAAIRRRAEDVHYAGQGWLVPVLTAHPHLPRFALTDRAGAIRAFVSPRAGLNLRRYLRQEVGIVGRETARTDDTAPHLLAERVVMLDRHR